MNFLRIKHRISRICRIQTYCKERVLRTVLHETHTFLTVTVVVLFVAILCAVVWKTYHNTRPPGNKGVRPAYLITSQGNASHESTPTTCSLRPDDERTLIDLNDFTLLMNDPKCNSSSPPFIVVIIHTAPSHIFHRNEIRKTWGQGLHLVFLVGATHSPEAQESLEEENNEYHDLVQGNFLDDYRNMTYKHVMGLKWVTYYCPGATYILKTDDDVFVNTPLLKEFLNRELSPLGARRLVLCEIFHRALVFRSHRSKWRVSFKEYPHRYYPVYCAGWVIVYSPDVVFELYCEAQRSEYFWVDDVHITGTLLSRINIAQTSILPLVIREFATYNMLHWDTGDEFLFSLSSPLIFEQLWELVNTPSKIVRNKNMVLSLG